MLIVWIILGLIVLWIVFALIRAVMTDLLDAMQAVPAP